MANNKAAQRQQLTTGQVLAGPFALLWAGAFVAVLTASFLLEGANIWAGFTYQPGPWCELERTASFIREPANAWSDFTFLAVGLFMIYCGIHNMSWPVTNAKGEKLNNPIVSFPAISVIWGVANVIHACGTFWYHSCRCREGKHYDEFAMFTISAFPFFYNFLRISLARQATASALKGKPMKPNSAHLLTAEEKEEASSVNSKVLMMLAGYAMFAIFCYQLFDFSFYNDILRDCFMALILGLDVATMAYYINFHVNNKQQWNRDKKLLIAAVILFIVGYAAHTLDRHKIVCSPTSIFQGHAIWHVLCAFALCVLYTMFRHEHFHALPETWSESGAAC